MDDYDWRYDYYDFKPKGWLIPISSIIRVIYKFWRRKIW